MEIPVIAIIVTATPGPQVGASQLNRLLKLHVMGRYADQSQPMLQSRAAKLFTAKSQLVGQVLLLKCRNLYRMPDITDEIRNP